MHAGLPTGNYQKKNQKLLTKEKKHDTQTHSLYNLNLNPKVLNQDGAAS